MTPCLCMLLKLELKLEILKEGPKSDQPSGESVLKGGGGAHWALEPREVMLEYQIWEN